MKDSLKGFSIPKKSLTDSINEKLINMASSANEKKEVDDDDKDSWYVNESEYGSGSSKKGNFSCGKKRTFEEMSSSQSWTKKYDRALPEEIMILCCDDRCDLCAVDITSSVLRDAHYNGAKHEKKVRAKLQELITNDEDRPKRVKVDQAVSSGGVAAAMDFLKKIEADVDRDPSKQNYGDMKLEEWQKVWLEKWDRPVPASIISMCRIMKCDICEASFNSGIMAKSHYEGKNHEKKLTACLKVYCTQHNLELPQKKLSSGGNYEKYCHVCECELSSESMARLHYAGQNHVKRKLRQMSALATTSAVEEARSGRFGIGTDFIKNKQPTVKSDDDHDDLREKLADNSELDCSFGSSGVCENKKPVPLMSLTVTPPKPVAKDYFSDVPGVAQSSLVTQSRADYSCEICGLECLGSKQSYEAHVHGKAHAKKVKESEEGGSETFYCDICNVTSPNQSSFETHIRGSKHARRRDQSEDRVDGKKKKF